MDDRRRTATPHDLVEQQAVDFGQWLDGGKLEHREHALFEEHRHDHHVEGRRVDEARADPEP